RGCRVFTPSARSAAYCRGCAGWFEAESRKKAAFLVTAQVGRKAEQAGKNFFSEEKKQKTFISCVQQRVQIGGFCAARNGEKFFGSFSKKNCLPSFLFKWLPHLGSCLFEKRNKKLLHIPRPSVAHGCYFFRATHRKRAGSHRPLSQSPWNKLSRTG
ncbi:MAG TPA: hypothetical protein VMB71_15325, partial [Acetobacteraceae bacterium]|nr:hypothetical protein [Acetobacteraceae bacterium]